MTMGAGATCIILGVSHYVIRICKREFIYGDD